MGFQEVHARYNPGWYQTFVLYGRHSTCYLFYAQFPSTICGILLFMARNIWHALKLRIKLSFNNRYLFACSTSQAGGTCQSCFSTSWVVLAKLATLLVTNGISFTQSSIGTRVYVELCTRWLSGKTNLGELEGADNDEARERRRFCRKEGFWLIITRIGVILNATVPPRRVLAVLGGIFLAIHLPRGEPQWMKMSNRNVRSCLITWGLISWSALFEATSTFMSLRSRSSENLLIHI